MEILQSLEFPHFTDKIAVTETEAVSDYHDTGYSSRQCFSSDSRTFFAIELYAAIAANNSKLVTSLMRHPSRQLDTSIDIAGHSALTFCCTIADSISMHETLSVLKVLLEFKFPVNKRERRTKSRDTPLLIACKKQSHQLVELLLANGASANLADLETKETPLHLVLKQLKLVKSPAKKNQLIRLAKILLQSSDLDVTSKTSDCISLLKLAIATSNLDLISLLIQKGHSNFDQVDVQESLDQLDSTLLEQKQKQLVYTTLQQELSPRSLQTISKNTVYTNLRRRSSTAISMLPCSNRLKHLIKSCADTQTEAKSVTKEKDLAIQYLLMF